MLQCACSVKDQRRRHNVVRTKKAAHKRQQGVKLIIFSDSHLAPKFFKVVANSKKVCRHFQRQTKSFFTLSAF